MSDVDDDVELPYPDCKVAEKLAMGGPVFLYNQQQDLQCNGHGYYLNIEECGSKYLLLTSGFTY